MPPRTATVEYLVEVAKDWTLACFAAAQSSGFVLTPQRFELRGAGVVRRALAPDSPEAASPFDAVRRVRAPTAWSHSTLASMLAETETETVEFEQEVIEILAMEGDAVLAETAAVIRISGLAPCLGPFLRSMMTLPEPRYQCRSVALSPGAFEQLTRLVYELLDAHDDTARIATGQDLDRRWPAHLSYLCDLQRVARELLAHAAQQDDAEAFGPRSDAPARGQECFRCKRRLSLQILPSIVDRGRVPPISKGGRR